MRSGSSAIVIWNALSSSSKAVGKQPRRGARGGPTKSAWAMGFAGASYQLSASSVAGRVIGRRGPATTTGRRAAAGPSGRRSGTGTPVSGRPRFRGGNRRLRPGVPGRRGSARGQDAATPPNRGSGPAAGAAPSSISALHQARRLGRGHHCAGRRRGCRGSDNERGRDIEAGVASGVDSLPLPPGLPADSLQPGLAPG